MSNSPLNETEERANLRNLFRQTPEMVCILSGPDHVFEFVNEAHIKALGFDATGMRVREAQPESVEVHGILDEVYRTGITADLKEIPVTLTDRVRYFNLTYAARKNSEGNVDGIMIMGREVTEDVLNRRGIHEAGERYKLLFDHSPLPKWIFDLETMKFQDVNQTAITTYGYSREEFLKMSLSDIRPQEEVAAFQKISARPFRVGHIERIRNFRHTKKDGTRIDVEISSIDILFNGRPSRFAAVFDLTDRLKAERDQALLFKSLQVAKKEADRANASKTQFLANMSHEIRTPLAAIMGFSELLKGRTLEGDAEAGAYLQRITQNAVQLGRLIDELLDLSKIEAEKFEIERNNFDLVKMIEDIFSDFSLRAREKGLSFGHRQTGEVPRFIKTDQMRLRQILTNIIGNAIKFTEKGKVEVEFFASEADGQKLLNLRITDTGIGLSPEQQLKIFEPFVQADTSVTRKYGGTGLGLVLSKRFARLLGGNLVLERSALGEGSCFVVSVAFNEGETLPAPAGPAPEKPAQPLAGKKILVVDDSEDNQTIIQIFLEKEGAEVHLAVNGLEGVEKMRQQKFDAVLMDIQMPVMDGYQALREAREEGLKLPIIALTAHALKQEKEMCLRAGFTDYMSKPIDRAALVQRLSEV